MTRIEIVRMALRRLGVLAVDETPDADTFAYADGLLDGMYARLQAEAPVPFSLFDIPDAVAQPLAAWLAAEAGPAYGLQARGGMLGVLAVIRPDDRRDVAEPEYY